MGCLFAVIYFVFIIITLFVVLTFFNLIKLWYLYLREQEFLDWLLPSPFRILQNFISGVFISLRRPIQIGDIVKIGEYMGEVTDINLRDTVLLTFQGQLVIIPNKSVFQNPIENFSMLGKRRLDLEVGVSYGEDLERVMRITLDAVKNIEGLSKDEQTTMFYKEFGGSSINYTIRLWLENVKPASYLIVCKSSNNQYQKAYDENDIMIPFPIRTLDFGIKGGKELSEVNLSILDGKSS
ncbi:MAG: mechanosensitive ion channel [Saprospiraceae bacterium]|uniref:mechanosensitive ion channel family protein n=1 Tax=Candidatus Brachybacter algidus TaxID=2982024 RepID=UPI00257DC1BD|nr:mechanosensitive ion channel domain-containing protein [Candidatus Brachybacter algidus]MBK7604723.1 mechanosensitive ion channel [Candidatus Brachybacter algidus]